MNKTATALALLGMALLAFLGRYEVQPGLRELPMRIDRWTGTVTMMQFKDGRMQWEVIREPSK